MSTQQQPTRVRYVVLAFMCALAMITYLDRVCFAHAGDDIAKELGLNTFNDINLALVMFNVAYAVFEVPTGWLGDVFGPRKTLIRIVLWWSLFTALTGMVGLDWNGLTLGLTALVVIRFLFGVGEAGAFPNITRALHNWFPFHERGMAQGWVFMSARFLGGLTPFVWGLLVTDLGLDWRDIFWVFGGLGVVWCAAFALWFRNRPEEKVSVNEAELKLITADRIDLDPGHANVPWLKLLASPNLWALCFMYFGTAYGWYFHITYLPQYCEKQLGVDRDSRMVWLYQGGPLLAGALGCLLGGYLTDWFIRKTGNRKWGRRLTGIIGQGMAGVCFLACIVAPTTLTFFLAVTLAGFFNDLTLSSAWATCQDIGKRYSAIVAGSMNTVGNIGGAVSLWVLGLTLNHYLDVQAASAGVPVKDLSDAAKAAAQLPGYHLNFAIFAGVYGIAALLWLGIDSTKPVIPEAET